LISNFKLELELVCCLWNH